MCYCRSRLGHCLEYYCCSVVGSYGSASDPVWSWRGWMTILPTCWLSVSCWAVSGSSTTAGSATPANRQENTRLHFSSLNRSVSNDHWWFITIVNHAYTWSLHYSGTAAEAVSDAMAGIIFITAAHVYTWRPHYFARRSVSFYSVLLGRHCTELNRSLPQVRSWARYDNGHSKFGVPVLYRGAPKLSLFVFTALRLKRECLLSSERNEL